MVQSSLDQRIGLICRLSNHIPRQYLTFLADGLCLSKICYGLAAYGKPRCGETDPVDGDMKGLQTKQNKLLRILEG